jgi:hypothetical protein
VAPLHLTFALTRRQRLAVELWPWSPALAAALGFTVEVAFLAVNVSRWFLPLLVLPPLVYRNLLAFVYDITVRGGRPVELLADDTALEVRTGGTAKRLPLDGIIQVFRAGDVWTVLHLDGTVLTIPIDVITAEQVEYLRGFARRAAAARTARAEN